jgi:hypothetical protein
LLDFGSETVRDWAVLSQKMCAIEQCCHINCARLSSAVTETVRDWAVLSQKLCAIEQCCHKNCARLSSAVSIDEATGTDDRGVKVCFPVGRRLLSSLPRPDQLWGYPASVQWATRVGGKAAEA